MCTNHKCILMCKFLHIFYRYIYTHIHTHPIVTTTHIKKENISSITVPVPSSSLPRDNHSSDFSPPR